MNKIAEKKAKDIAKKLEASQAYKFDNFSVVCGAIEGYNQAMQDFMEKAIEWILYHFTDSRYYNTHADEEIKEQFKNYMEEEL